jgi:phosphoribosylformylglycinamidine cyclo-ligase
MPGFYPEGEYDIAGFSVGAVNRKELIDGSKIQEGDILIGLSSSGFHSNGYSLVRKVFAPYSMDKVFPELNEALGEALLRPTRIYVKTILPLLASGMLLGMAHITGGGLTENIPRVLPSGLGVKIDLNAWEIPPVFSLIQRIGEIEQAEMLRTFNMGIGFVMVVHPQDAEQIQRELRNAGEGSFIIGEVIQGEGVRYE